ncbi:hypothetical protein Ahy_A06g027853 [Arachis hypogaea]|uniref:Protein kinase domain-containing protein n=1 Tax=Arachis hypogaea TaxID=3818 RepID=A0A445CPZ4_ARAHY|nr:hypothetical protein Ahy_A06g027853 [Arachis hypogaea]
MTELLAESTTPSSSSLRLLCHLLIAAPFPEVSSPSSSEVLALSPSSLRSRWRWHRLSLQIISSLSRFDFLIVMSFFSHRRLLWSCRLLCSLICCRSSPCRPDPPLLLKDNISNQREKIVHLLANEQSRLRIPDATDPGCKEGVRVWWWWKELNGGNHEEELDDASIDPDVDLSYISIKSKQPETTNFGFPASDVGELQVDCLIGSGTFGTVYHGKWRGTDVAIKQITDRCFVRKPLEQERMAIKLVDLHHPNVVAFYGVVLDDLGGSVSTVTEYMVNGSLRTALLKNGRFCVDGLSIFDGLSVKI